MKRALPTLAAALLAAARLGAADFPAPGWKPASDPLASPDAVVGGRISIYAGQYPQSFNYYLDNNTFNQSVLSSLYDTLLDMNPVTLAYEPLLAKGWSISEDKKVFTFTLDERARWSDGTPVTSADVAWTFRAILDPKNLTGAHKVSLEVFEPPETPDARTVRFRAKTVHWRNLDALGGLNVLPMHAYEKLDFNKINFEFPVVSGQYRLGDVKEGVFANLERRADWWLRDDPRYRGTRNFQTMSFRFFADNENAFEAFRKGMIDLYPVAVARIWINETSGDRFEKNWIVKQKVQNYNPIGFQGFAINIRRPPFDDLKVRLALAHLLDREKMNRTIMYNQYFLHRSYYEDLYTKEQPCQCPLIAYDKDEARRLLKEAGWTANPKTGWIEKDGRKFSFKFLTRDPSSEKFLSIYAEDLKSVGIELVIEQKDWAAWSKDMDQSNYDMTWAAWGAGLFRDPEDMWASREADRKGGNNITGFKDPRVDELIEKQKTLFDLNARNAICRDIDGIVTRQVPYILLWNINVTRLLYWNKFGTPRTVLSKYGDERSAYSYWWVDPDSQAGLDDSMKRGTALPAKPPLVVFDEVFPKR